MTSTPLTRALAAYAPTADDVDKAPRERVWVGDPDRAGDPEAYWASRNQEGPHMEGVLLVSAAISLLGGLLALVKGQSRGRTLRGVLRQQAIRRPNRPTRSNQRHAKETSRNKLYSRRV